MKFRLFIFTDPEAHDRGFSLKGIKVPLTTWCPVEAPKDLLSFDDSPVWGSQFPTFWKVPVGLLCKARPELGRHLRGLHYYYIPVDWCDVAPVDSYDNL